MEEAFSVEGGHYSLLQQESYRVRGYHSKISSVYYQHPSFINKHTPCSLAPARMNSMKGLYGPRSSSSSASASTTSSPCAACKFLKRRCAPSCIFAPYFKSDEPRKFASVHKIFGASNVSKLLGQVPVELRDEAAATLTYEAEARLRDPVYGCVGDISLLQWKKMRLQEDLAQARVRLARYVNSGFIIPSASSSLSSPSPSPSSSASCYAPVGFFDDPDVRAQLGIYGFGDVGGGTGLSDVTDFQHR